MNQRGAVNYWYFIGMVVLAVVMVTFLQAIRKTEPAEESMALRVHKSGRFLERADGRPFFWNGGFALNLLDRGLPEAGEFLQARKEAGVSVLVGPRIFRSDAGRQAFADRDPSRPNEEWFRDLDELARRTREMDLYLAPVVTLGADAPALTAESARALGKWLGNRYRERQNMIWIVAWEYERSGQSNYKIYNALGEGLKEGHGGRHLMALVPWTAGSTGTFWQGVEWVSFNVTHAPGQAGAEDWMLTEMDYMRQPAKPTLPLIFIENGADAGGELTWRKRSYRALFAGGMGVISNWEDGSKGGLYLRRLMESRPLLQRVPDNRLLEFEPTFDDATRCQAAGDIMGSYAMIYVPESPRKIVVRLDRLFSRKIRAWWFNPRDGSSSLIGDYEKLEPTGFTSPPDGPDWVLVLDDAVKNYPPPGQPVPARAPAAGAAQFP